MTGPRIGVLALQGAVAPHVAALAALGAEPVEVRTPAHLDGLRALVLPGGESTTMSKLLDTSGLRDPLAELLTGGLPALGTCAGMILLAGEVLDGRADQRSFGAIDITVRRNAFGRQVDSFEAELDVDWTATGLGAADRAEAFHAVFIRAPVITEAGPEVEVLARVGDQPVLARQGRVIVASFHPELTDDLRLHRMLLDSLSRDPSPDLRETPTGP